MRTLLIPVAVIAECVVLEQRIRVGSAEVGAVVQVAVILFVRRHVRVSVVVAVIRRVVVAADVAAVVVAAIPVIVILVWRAVIKPINGNRRSNYNRTNRSISNSRACST